MYLSHTVTAFMDKCDVDYETVGHRHSATTNQTAFAAQVPRERLCKGVLISDEQDYVLAIIPASSRVDLRQLESLLGRHDLALASEDEISFMFPDCETGAIPALGLAYGIDTVVDESLLNQDDVYFEGGDHEHLVHVDAEGFHRLMAGAPHGGICRCE